MNTGAIRLLEQMGSSQAVVNYELLSGLTEQMREAAVLSDWDKLIGLERQRTALVTAIRSLDAEAVLDGAQRQQKNQLITQILAADAEIRNRIEAWLGDLQSSMQSNRQEQLLLKAYGLPHSSAKTSLHGAK